MRQKAKVKGNKVLGESMNHIIRTEKSQIENSRDTFNNMNFKIILILNSKSVFSVIAQLNSHILWNINFE